MTRRPREKEFKLHNTGMIFHSYGYIGWTQFWGALFTFLVVGNDFGFPPLTLLTMNGNFSMVYGTNYLNQYTYYNGYFQQFNLNQNSCYNYQ